MDIITTRRTKVEKGYELLADITVGTATTSVDITGLNIGKGDEVVLVSDCVNPTGSTSSPGIFFNGNNSVSSYYVQRLTANPTTVSGQRQNYNYMTNIVSGSSAISFCNIKLTNSGYAVYQANTNTRYGTSNTYLEGGYNTSTFTLSGITSIRIASDITNAIGIGSRFQLYRIGGA